MISVVHSTLVAIQFSSFDTNADEHLDGTELRSALLENEFEDKVTRKDVEDLIDAILLEDDLDNELRRSSFSSLVTVSCPLFVCSPTHSSILHCNVIRS